MLTALPLAVLAAVVCAPLLWVLQRPARLRDRRDPAVLLYRAQLAELDRDAVEGRVAAADLAGARLEIQRRLLAEDAAPVEAASRHAAFPLTAALVAIPLAAAALYALGGRPDLLDAPAAPPAAAASGTTTLPPELVGLIRRALAEAAPGVSGSDAAGPDAAGPDVAVPRPGEVK